MKTIAYFGGLWGDEWPSIDWLEPHFRALPGGVSPLQKRKGGGRFEIEGAEGTGHLDRDNGRIDAELLLYADPKYGLLLDYRRFKNGEGEAFLSKGNLQRCLEWVKSPQGTPFSIGLFIPIERGRDAVKEFIQSKGARPAAIEWVAIQDLPPGTFPTPDRWRDLEFEDT